MSDQSESLPSGFILNIDQHTRAQFDLFLSAGGYNQVYYGSLTKNGKTETRALRLNRGTGEDGQLERVLIQPRALNIDGAVVAESHGLFKDSNGKQFQLTSCPYIRGQNLYNYQNSQLSRDPNFESREFSKVKPIDVNEVSSLIAQSAVIISDVNKKGFEHGDIKPANIMREKSGQIKIIDWDEMKSIGEKYTSFSATEGYFPPDMANSFRKNHHCVYNGKADVYAVPHPQFTRHPAADCIDEPACSGW